MYRYDEDSSDTYCRQINGYKPIYNTENFSKYPSGKNEIIELDNNQ